MEKTMRELDGWKYLLNMEMRKTYCFNEFQYKLCEVVFSGPILK